MFAVITPPLIVGAIADRIKFKPYLIFVALWSLLVFCPACHWIWGYGFLAQMGVWDWAGGYVVHTTAGFSALAANDLAMLSAANSQISACVMSVGWVGLDVL